MSLNKISYKLPPALAEGVKSSLADWKTNNKVARLWQKDPSLWTGADEGKWLGWLTVVDEQLKEIANLKKLAAEIKKAKFRHAVLLGMGGSSLCVEVLRLTFGKFGGYPELHVLDSTDPAQVKAVEKKLDLKKTLCIVSSKSGSTLEPNIFKQYFYERIRQKVGDKEVGSHFIAVTDPGSKMEQVAKDGGFRHIFAGVPSIGGRYSALSHFGTVPGSVMGLDLSKFLKITHKMVKACGPATAPEKNPGVILGTILGVAANHGRDKITVFTSPGISDAGAWLEQLIAESTGKVGKGIIPVDREKIGKPAVYGKDRVFAYLRLAKENNRAMDAAVTALEKAGHPVVRIVVGTKFDLGQEFFRWEIATATAGSIIGINTFNQPDVEASKIETRKLTGEYESTGKLPSESPFFEDQGLKLFADDKNAAFLKNNSNLAEVLRAHLGRIGAGDYFALLGYIQMNDAHEKALQGIRHQVRDAKKSATCLGFGPRFLHSTGQAYKGGPNSGVFLQLTCDDAADIPVPGQKYTFGIVKAAQARGDFSVLSERDRRALRIHLGKNLKGDLAKLAKAVKQALS
ncbi:MAG TPA: bifunctional transaldolase/phosoglucose isomerase [Candidatus Acidoferrum sp.]|nr:bifunctional transaldolase/phosoglucose isomerase [Candidatus Acidoferrum sp.]